MNRILKWLITIIFCSFAVVNLNDPDGFIWVTVYLGVAFLPLLNKVASQYLKIVAVILALTGFLIAMGFLNSIMPWQVDDRMINMWENQREGLGLILGAVWLWFGRSLK